MKSELDMNTQNQHSKGHSSIGDIHGTRTQTAEAVTEQTDSKHRRVASMDSDDMQGEEYIRSLYNQNV